ncbi:MAG TPA: abortive infection protein, partial [Desulfosporosinus sp.]|nr:abortive infection protein [Desulfosporosinus sp.]
MLIQFKVGNFLSFRDIVTFSMVASPIKEHLTTHVFKANKYFNLLKIGTIYGANASGKSNLFKATSFMSSFVENSSKDSQAEEEIDVENFRLSTETESKPSIFEMTFIQDSIRYRYGFEVNNFKVESEWLFQAVKQAETKLFQRNGKEYEIGDNFLEGKDLESKTRNNALFLSVVAQFNGKIAISILKWFKNMRVISGLKDTYAQVSKKLLE